MKEIIKKSQAYAILLIGVLGISFFAIAMYRMEMTLLCFFPLP